MGGFERGSRRAGRQGSAALVVLVVVSTWLAACPGLEVEFEKVGQDPASTPGTWLEQLSEDDLLAHLQRLKELDRPGRLRPSSVAAELGRRARGGSLSDDGWRKALTRDVIHTRERWPRDVPLQVWIREAIWLRGASIVLEALEPPLGSVDASADHADCASGMMVLQDRRRRLTLGALPNRTREVRFAVTVEDEEPSDGRRRASLWKGELRLPVEAVDSAESCLSRVGGSELDQLVREGTALHWSTKSVAVLNLNSRPSKKPALNGVGVSVNVELLHDGSVVERKNLCVQDALRWFDFTDRRGSCGLEQLPAEDALVNPELARWQVRLRGTWEGLLATWEAESWWDGELTIPLAELIERGRERR